MIMKKLKTDIGQDIVTAVYHIEALRLYLSALDSSSSITGSNSVRDEPARLLAEFPVVPTVALSCELVPAVEGRAESVIELWSNDWSRARSVLCSWL